MIQLFHEARLLQAELDRHALRFCFIGGVALQHWGEPRVTRDLDLSVFTGFGGEAPIIDTLLAAYPGRIGEAREFALRHRVLLLTTGGATGISVDVALAGLPFEDEMIRRSVLIEFDADIILRICSAEDLVVMKAFADRLQDRADLVGIAQRRGHEMDWAAVIERLEPLIEAKGEPVILAKVAALRDEYS